MDLEISPLVASETIAILNNTDVSLLAKVPTKLLKTLQCRANECKTSIQIDPTKSYADQNFSQESRAIITLIYRQYWCNEEERKELDKHLIENQEKKEKEKRELYPTENLFKDRNSSLENFQNNIENQKNTDLIVFQDLKWYQKVIANIKRLFNKS